MEIVYFANAFSVPINEIRIAVNLPDIQTTRREGLTHEVIPLEFLPHMEYNKSWLENTN